MPIVAQAVLKSSRVLGLAGILGLALLAAACGGAPSSKVAQVGTTTGTTNAAPSSGAAAFSACMRSHGLPDFPDPGSDGRIHALIDKGSPAYQGAYGACRALDKGGGVVNGQTRAQLEQQLPQLLAFAKCMRAHGVPKFADPEISPNGHSIAFAVIDTHSPAYAPAAAACRGKLSRNQSSKLFPLLGGGKQSVPRGGH
jgi:hypothetical protein